METFCTTVKFWPRVAVAQGTSHLKRMGALDIPFRGKNQFVPLRVFSLKMSTAGAFAVPLSLLSWKKYNGIWYSLNWYLLGVKNNSSHRIFSVIGGSFPNFCQELLSFLNGDPPPGGCSCKVPMCFSLLNSIVMWVVFWQHWTGTRLLELHNVNAI